MLRRTGIFARLTALWSLIIFAIFWLRNTTCLVVWTAYAWLEAVAVTVISAIGAVRYILLFQVRSLNDEGFAPARIYVGIIAEASGLGHIAIIHATI